MELKLTRTYSIDYTILKIEIVVSYWHKFVYLLQQHLQNKYWINQFLPCYDHGLRKKQCNSFANAPYDSFEKCQKAHACHLYWLFSPTKAFQFFFIFYFSWRRERYIYIYILVRTQSSTTRLVNAGYLPKQLSVFSLLQHTLPWPRLLKHGWF